MRKKLLVVVLSLSMCMSTGAVAFAAESGDETQNQAERDARVIEKVVGTDDVINNIQENKNKFSASGEDVKIDIPKTGKDEVLINGDDLKAIGMGLPSEVSTSEGVLTANGTVVYNSNKEDVSVSVQALEETYEGIVVNAVRTMVTIENKNAPKEYSFDFNLPSGYTMVKDTDYDEGDGLEEGVIFILDVNGDIIGTINPAWAKDGNGEDLKTYYQISGHSLEQVIEFDENTVFPIIADPTYTLYSTSSGTMSTAGWAVAGLAAAICVKWSLPASATFVITGVAAAIADKCKTIRYVARYYSYTSNGVFHQKRVYTLANASTNKLYSKGTYYATSHHR